MPIRRQEDQNPRVLFARPVPVVQAQNGGAGPLAGITVHTRGRMDIVSAQQLDRMTVTEAEPLIVVLEAGASEIWSLRSTDARRLPEPPTGEDLVSVINLEAETWRRGYLAARRKRRFSEGFVLLTEHLNRSSTSGELWEVVARDAPDLMECHAAVVFGRRPSGDPASFVPRHSPGFGVALPALGAAELPPPFAPALLRSDAPQLQPQRQSSLHEKLVPLLDPGGASQVACITVGDHGLLVLIERRFDREFDGEDWFHLQLLARHLDRALTWLAATAADHT